MDKIERQQIAENTQRLEEWENTPPMLCTDYDDMSHPELIKLLTAQRELIEKLERKLSEAEDRVRRAEGRAVRAEQSEREIMAMLQESLRKQDEQTRLIQEMRNMFAKETKEKEDAANQAKADRAARFANKSQKGIHNRKEDKSSNADTGDNKNNDSPNDDNQEPPSAQEQKEDFCGPGSVEVLPESDCVDENGNLDLPKPGIAKPTGKGSRPWRAGKKHNKPHADVVKTLRADKSLLPQEYKFVRYFTKSVFTKKTVVYQTDYQMILATDADGREVEIWLPEDVGSIQTLDCLKGTSADADMLTETVYDHCVLNVPYYRLWQANDNCGLHIKRQTYINWLYEASKPLACLIPMFLDKAVEKDSIVNCDETWCKVKINGKFTKRYTWCLVNKELGIVIYFYKKGFRSRDALKDILGNRQPMAFQTDGYNVYMYLDDELSDVTHLCCLAHSRAKFKTAHDITNEPDALFFLEKIEELYMLERHYQAMHYTAEQIKDYRNDARTTAIIGDMWSRLERLMADGHPPRSELLDKAVRYMFNYWKQLMAYRNDGRFCIDNNIAERYIKPLANERKNSLFYGSHKMAEAMTVYHSLISTCKACGVSIKKYFKEVFTRIIHQDTDWASMMPQTIALHC